MKKLFSSLDRFEIQAVRSELDALSIPYLVKNEYAGGAVGELPWQDAQQELWLIDDTWYQRASAIVSALVARMTQSSEGANNDWICASCSEENGAAFDHCWHCQTLRQ